MEKCPHCKQDLTEIKEEFRSIATYKFKGKQFEVEETKEELNYICPFCGNLIVPDRDLIRKLPILEDPRCITSSG